LPLNLTISWLHSNSKDGCRIILQNFHNDLPGLADKFKHKSCLFTKVNSRSLLVLLLYACVRVQVSFFPHTTTYNCIATMIKNPVMEVTNMMRENPRTYRHHKKQSCFLSFTADFSTYPC
jgi:hypothetical protein